jgi:hypothetical protein
MRTQSLFAVVFAFCLENAAAKIHSSRASDDTPRRKELPTLYKNEVNGLVAYTSKQIDELSNKFSSFSWTQSEPGYSFNNWKTWSESDGFLCKDDTDCKWLDSNMKCQGWKSFDWTINVSYFYYRFLF